MTNDEIYSAVQQKYRNLQKEAELKCQKEIDCLYSVHPELKKLNDAIFIAKSNLLRAGMKHFPKDELEKLENVIKNLQSEKDEYIRRNNIDTDVFSIKYNCTDCNDTGKLSDGSRCHCFADYYAQERFGKDEMRILERENFQTFNSDIFPERTKEGLEQRKQMEAIRKMLEDYCKDFPKVPKKNFLISGLSGTGKSFLLNCVAKALYDRRISVVKISAYKLINNLFDFYITDSKLFNEELERVSDIDVLLIDDLGTELMKDNFTLNTLYYIFDRRIELEKATVVSTNLSAKNLEERYSDRIMSRLLNKKTTTALLLSGTDVRIRPNNQ